MISSTALFLYVDNEPTYILKAGKRGYGPAGHETYAVPVKIVEGASLERTKHFKVFRVGNAL